MSSHGSGLSKSEYGHCLLGEYMHTPILSPQQRRGRLFLIIAIAITLLGDFCIIASKLLAVGFTPYSIGSILRWMITAALFSVIWRGRNWARWLMVCLLGLGLVVSVPGMLRSWNLLLVGLVLQFGIAVLLLAVPPSVSAFMRYQSVHYDEYN